MFGMANSTTNQQDKLQRFGCVLLWCFLRGVFRFTSRLIWPEQVESYKRVEVNLMHHEEKPWTLTFAIKIHENLWSFPKPVGWYQELVSIRLSQEVRDLCIMPAGEKNPELSTNESWNRLNGELGWKDMRAQQTHPTQCAVLDPNAWRDSLAMHSSGGISSHMVMCQNPDTQTVPIAGEWTLIPWTSVLNGFDPSCRMFQSHHFTPIPSTGNTGADFISLWGFTGHRVLSARWASPVALDLQRVLSSPPDARKNSTKISGVLRHPGLGGKKLDTQVEKVVCLLVKSSTKWDDHSPLKDLNRIQCLISESSTTSRILYIPANRNPAVLDLLIGGPSWGNCSPHIPSSKSKVYWCTRTYGNPKVEKKGL